MRMRKKPNLIPRMERCAHVNIQEPEALMGRWRQEFPGFSQLWVELGCGKGRFLAETAEAEPGIFLLPLSVCPMPWSLAWSGCAPPVWKMSASWTGM